MNTLILLLNRDSAWSPENWALQNGGERTSCGHIMIERPSGWLSVVSDQEVLNEFDDEGRSKLSAMLAEPTSFTIEWKGSGLLEALLHAVPPETGGVVDNDHGLLVPIHAICDLPLRSWVRESELP